MNLKLLLILSLLVINFGAFFRFRKTKYVYFFYVVSLIDPFYIIINSIFHINNTVIYYSFANFCYYAAFPLFENKIKIILFVPTIISLFYYLSNPLLTMMNVIVIQSAMIIFLLGSIRLMIITHEKTEIFKLLLIVSLFLNIVRSYFYYNSLNYLIQYFNEITIIDFVVTVLIIVVGPNYFLRVPKTHKPKEKDSTNNLSDREIKIIEMISNGFTSKEIAEKLFLSKKTIDYYRSNIRAKLNVTKKSELINFYNTNLENVDVERKINVIRRLE